MSFFLLFDNNDSGNSFVAAGLGVPVTVIRSPKCSRKIFSWLNGVWAVVAKSHSRDTVICWYDFQAVMCWWICLLLLKRRKIVCINVLLKDKPTLRNRFVSYLYKKALLAKNFRASVTSVEYGEWLNRKLGINVNFTLIHDVYHASYEYGQSVEIEPRSVFCGGCNGRDWEFIVDVARAMPDVRFNIVLPRDVYLKYCSKFSSNMNVRYDIPYDEFMKELCSSTVVCLPLDTEAPAGLIVMFQAAANLKPIITTKTVTTSEYITSERGMAIKNDVEVWCDAIGHCFDKIEELNRKAVAFREYLIKNCSEEDFIQNLNKILI